MSTQNPHTKTPDRLVGSGALFGRAAKYFAPPFRYDDEGQMIFDNEGNRVLDVRGWGHLHGLGACALPLPMAEEVQDEFGAQVAALLTSHWPNTDSATRSR